MFRKKTGTLFSASLLLLVFGSYLVPEHYLKHFHPHEHASCTHLCAHEEETLAGIEHRCDDEKEYFFSPLPGAVLITVSAAPAARMTTPGLPRPPSDFFHQTPPRSPPVHSC